MNSLSFLYILWKDERSRNFILVYSKYIDKIDGISRCGHCKGSKGGTKRFYDCKRTDQLPPPPTWLARVLLAIVKRARGANNRYSLRNIVFEIRIWLRDNALLCTYVCLLCRRILTKRPRRRQRVRVFPISRSFLIAILRTIRISWHLLQGNQFTD